MPERIDAHHHLWHYTPDQFEWIDDRMKLLRRDFLPTDLKKELLLAGITDSVAIIMIWRRR